MAKKPLIKKEEPQTRLLALARVLSKKGKKKK